MYICQAQKNIFKLLFFFFNICSSPIQLSLPLDKKLVWFELFTLYTSAFVNLVFQNHSQIIPKKEHSFERCYKE